VSTKVSTAQAHKGGHKTGHKSGHGMGHGSNHEQGQVLGHKQDHVQDIGKPWFHGSKVSIAKWVLDFAGSVGHDQEGPGIYFTSLAENARRYGKHFHEVRLDLRRTIPAKGQVSPLTVRSLIQASPECQGCLEDWGEDPGQALRAAVKCILDANQGNPQQVFQSIWYDFYRGNPKAYLQEMVKLGYDGVVVDVDAEERAKKGEEPIQHAIVFNVEAIRMLAYVALEGDDEVEAGPVGLRGKAGRTTVGQVTTGKTTVEGAHPPSPTLPLGTPAGQGAP